MDDSTLNNFYLPRRFPLPTLPFQFDFNGYGVGAKVQLTGTPYVSDKSGFDIYLFKSGEDIPLMATISFDSEQRSVIDVKSCLKGKWSPTIRHIAIGIVIDRQFTLDITVNSGDFVITVNGFKVTEFVKRCDDVKTLLIKGALVIDEVVMIPSLLHCTPPPAYTDVVKEPVDVAALLNKIQLLPGAPELPTSNTKFRLDAPHNQEIHIPQPTQPVDVAALLNKIQLLPGAPELPVSNTKFRLDARHNQEIHIPQPTQPVDVAALLNKIQLLPGAPELPVSNTKFRLDTRHNQEIHIPQPTQPVDVAALLNKIQLLPGAPELPVSNTKFRLDTRHNQEIHIPQPISTGGDSQFARRMSIQDDDDIRIGTQSASMFTTDRCVPPRPPPPIKTINGSLSPPSVAVPAYDEDLPSPRKVPLNQPELPPTPAGLLGPTSKAAPHRLNGYDPVQFESANSTSKKISSKYSRLYPKLDTSSDSDNEKTASTGMQNGFEHSKDRKDVVSSNSSSSRRSAAKCGNVRDHTEQLNQFSVNGKMGHGSIPNGNSSDFEERRQSQHFASARLPSERHPSAHRLSDTTNSSAYLQPSSFDSGTSKSPRSFYVIRVDPSNISQRQRKTSADDSHHPHRNSASTDTQPQKRTTRSESHRNCDLNIRSPDGNYYRVNPSRSRRPASTVGIYTPLFTTHQLQDKVGAFGKSATSFLKSSLMKGTKQTKKQLILISLSERQQLTITATPIAEAKKFDVGLMHFDDYVLMLSARFDHFHIVLNSTRAGSWQKEEKVHHFPFRRELSFELKIKAANPLQIFVNDKFICEYNLRCGLPADAIQIDNNLRLEKFSIE